MRVGKRTVHCHAPPPTEDRLHDLKLLESGGDGGAASKPLVPRAQDADVDDDDDDDDDGDEVCS